MKGHSMAFFVGWYLDEHNLKLAVVQLLTSRYPVPCLISMCPGPFTYPMVQSRYILIPRSHSGPRRSIPSHETVQ